MVYPKEGTKRKYFCILHCVCISGGVHHSHDALRGPFCPADPRYNSTRVHRWHQSLPPHRFPAPQQPRGQIQSNAGPDIHV